MVKTYLITRPEHDDTTHYLSKWCEETITLARNKGLKVLDLHREKAVRKEFEERIDKLSPNLIVLNGHGDADKVTGNNKEPILVAGDNEGLLRDKIVYAISCSSAKLLGPKSIEKGTLNYSGYDDDFIFFYDPNNMTKPLSDETAKLFLEHSNLFIESMIKGNTIRDSKQRAENKLRENIIKLSSSSSIDSNLIRFLWWDLVHFVSHGNQDIAI